MSIQKISKISTLLICLLLVFTASAQKYDFKKAEQECRRLIYKSPDSALAIIKNTLAQPNIHDTVYGNTYNLYGIYYGMTGKPDSVIYYTKRSLTYLNDYPKTRVRSLMNLALGYRNKGEYQTAIKYQKEALKFYRDQKNKVGVAIAYGELASNYNYMLKYDTSVKYLLKSIEIFKAEKDTIHLAVVRQKLANTYLAKNNFEFALDMYRECIKDFRAFGMEKNYYLTLVNMGEALIHLKQYKEAQKILSEAAEGLKQYGDEEIIGVCYSKIGNINYIKGNSNKALKYYEIAFNNTEKTKSIHTLRIGAEYIGILNSQKQYDKSLNIINHIEKLNIYNKTNIEDQMVYSNAAAQTYKATNNPVRALDAFEKTIALKDSIDENEKQSAIRESQAKFQTALQRQKNMSLEASNILLTKQIGTEKHMLILYIVVSLAVLCVVLLLLRGYRLRYKLQQQELKSIETDKYIVEQKHLYEYELNAKQKETIEEKQRELTSSALVMSNFQDSIKQIIQNCDDGAYKTITDIKKELAQLNKQNDYWKQFEKRFNSLHPDFATELNTRFTKLTKNDIEFCSLLKLNLSNKEIAALLQISHESVITKKYRIKKKMEIQNDEDFDQLLLSLP
ncbi:tetratricopeptide repeat protein [Flavobacterium rhizosphaerae]|uniref:Tetratricopeptide repeat protein n=1 Tax=Flavobacterium rhizosphaerae TaxID=3163298 RepID=A0ABW8YT30_9FLAO